MAKTQIQLPPDPEDMNDDRAEWANIAIKVFQQTVHCEDDEALGDLLADIMHWCDRNNTDFEAVLSKARECYKEETREIPVTE